MDFLLTSVNRYVDGTHIRLEKEGPYGPLLKGTEGRRGGGEKGAGDTDRIVWQPERTGPFFDRLLPCYDI